MKSSRIIATTVLSICFPAIAKDVLANTAVQEKTTDATKGTTVITGHGPALPEEVVVRLYKWEDGHSELIGTDTIGNGQFRFEIPLKEDMAVCSLIFDY